MSCNCQVCQRYNEHKKNITLLNEANLPELAKYFEEIYDILNEVEYDLEHKNAILDGTWPNSIEILTKALDKAKSKL